MCGLHAMMLLSRLVIACITLADCSLIGAIGAAIAREPACEWMFHQRTSACDMLLVMSGRCASEGRLLSGHGRPLGAVASSGKAVRFEAARRARGESGRHR